MNKLKKALKSKTVWFGLSIMATSVLQAYVDYLPVDVQYRILVGVLLGGIVIILRFLTTGAINDK